MRNFLLLFVLLAAPHAVAEVTYSIRNTTNQTYFVSGSYDQEICGMLHTSGGCGDWWMEYEVTGWFAIAPGETREFKGEKYVAIAVSSGGGRDYIKGILDRGDLITGTTSHFYVHPNKAFKYNFRKLSNGYLIRTMKVDGVYHTGNRPMNAAEFETFLKSKGIRSFRSVNASSGYNQFYID